MAVAVVYDFQPKYGVKIFGKDICTAQPIPISPMKHWCWYQGTVWSSEWRHLFRLTHFLNWENCQGFLKMKHLVKPWHIAAETVPKKASQLWTKTSSRTGIVQLDRSWLRSIGERIVMRSFGNIPANLDFSNGYWKRRHSYMIKM